MKHPSYYAWRVISILAGAALFTASPAIGFVMWVYWNGISGQRRAYYTSFLDCWCDAVAIAVDVTHNI